ncbi:MAG TPA: DUF72 domain-containing protein [Candidatus Sulfotelmatobacter sp.]|nr:DUF72 domain-containing protein [Candidatus Sulfotelmatobacter sp.]
MHNIHIGTMGWSYDFWKGSFYPENLSSNEFLAYYSSKFDTVEVDYTFYRIPRKETVINWKKQTSKVFLFSLKFPRTITHIKMLEDCEEETAVFLKRVELLEDKLGPLLLQFSPSFGIEHIPLLEKFLKNLPKKHHYVVEVRNKNLLGESLFSLLRSNNVALAWTDSVSMPTTTELSSNFIYIRWEGDRKKVNGTLGKIEIEKTNEIDEWTKTLKPFINKRITIFGYFSKYYSGNPTLDGQFLLYNLAIKS